ncbi:MAG: hypothetical protein ACEY3A_02420 [Wolbachia sp.]
MINSFATTLPIPKIIGLVEGFALIASTIVSAGIYMMSKPKTEMGVKQVIPRDISV